MPHLAMNPVQQGDHKSKQNRCSVSVQYCNRLAIAISKLLASTQVSSSFPSSPTPIGSIVEWVSGASSVKCLQRRENAGALYHSTLNATYL